MSKVFVCDGCGKVNPEEVKKLIARDPDEIFDGEDFIDADFCEDCLNKIKEGIKNMFADPTPHTVHHPDPREYEFQTKKGKPVRNKVEKSRRQVIDLWNEGKTNKEIADAMGLNPSTISNHLKRFRLMYGDDVVDARNIPYELPKAGDDE